MSLLARFYQMDVRSPRLWYVSCDYCHGTGYTGHSWMETDPVKKCLKCANTGKIPIVVRRPDPAKIALRQLGIACCLIAGGVGVYLIFFGS